MSDVENTVLIKAVLRALYITAGRRTTQTFAVAIIDTIIKTIAERYDFLKNIQIYNNRGSEDFIDISSDVNSIHPAKIGKVIEAIIQVILIDLKEKAGYYFIKEIKRNLSEEIILKLKECGVDLELLSLQQQYIYNRQNREKTKTGYDKKGKSLDNVSMLGYTKKNISSWHYDPQSKTCIILDEEGKELDRINLDTIIRNYIGTLTEEGVIEPSKDSIEKAKERIEINEKEFELLKMLHARDVDIQTAINLLNITEKQLNFMIRKLLTLEMLQYISSDEVALTDIGMNHVETKIKNKKII